MPTQDTKDQVVLGLQLLYSAVAILDDAYDQDDSLNDIQPKGFERIVPMSLDEWRCEIASYYEEYALALGLEDKDIPPFNDFPLTVLNHGRLQ